MLNIGLASQQSKWVGEINKLKGANVDTFAVSDFVLTSGFRHPHHNYEHTPSTAPLSPHMYGYALDVRGKTDAQDKPLDIDGDKKNTDAARNDMAEAAKPNTGARYTNIYSSKHVHADWAPSNWASRTNTSSAAKSYKLPPAGTDTRAVVKKPDEKKAAKLLPCGHEKGSPGTHVKTYHRACGHTDWYCLGAAGHNYNRCPKDSAGQICTTTKYPGYYMPCDTSHDHQYPTAADKIKRGACGHVYDHGSSSAYSHRPVDCPKQNGVSCQYDFYYACRVEHAHAYTSDPVNPKPSDPKPSDPKPSDPKPQVVKCANNNRLSGKCSYNRVVSGSDAYEHRTTCAAGHTYWSCNVTAVKAHSGHKAPTTPTTPTMPTTPTTPNAPTKPTPVSVSYHACGVHPTTTRGDHSLQASCSRDSSCIATSFYYCQHGSHTYPSVPKPTPKPPPAVKCPANSWTNCGGTSSHATKCKAGHTYYTCNPSAVSSHSGHKKPTPKPPAVKCPANSWTNCGGTSSHATKCKAGHSYYSCNPSAVNAHKWHRKAGVKCPAHAWTNCNGSRSHQTTCGHGHKYYTCNPAARRAHGWH